MADIPNIPGLQTGVGVYESNLALIKAFEAGQGQTTTPTTGVPPPITNVDDLFADVQSSTTIEDIRNTQAEEQAARRAQAENIFNPQIARAEEVGVRREGSGTATLGQNIGLGFSTAGLSFMNVLQEETQEAIDNVVSQKAAFISQGDIAAMQRADKAIQQLEDRKLKITLAKVDAGFKIAQQQISQAQLAIQQGQFDLDEQSFAEGQRRFNRTQGVVEKKLDIQISELDKENALDNLARMAESGIDLNTLSDEEITALERDAGLENGTVEMFYSRLREKADRNEVLDDIALETAIADLARTRQLLTGGDNLQASEGFFNSGTEQDVRATIEAAFTNLNIDPSVVAPTQGQIQSVFNNARGLFSGAEATDAAIQSVINNFLGASSTLPGEFNAVPQESINKAFERIKRVVVREFNLRKNQQGIKFTREERSAEIRSRLINSGFSQEEVNKKVK